MGNHRYISWEGCREIFESMNSRSFGTSLSLPTIISIAALPVVEEISHTDTPIPPVCFLTTPEDQSHFDTSKKLPRQCKQRYDESLHKSQTYAKLNARESPRISPSWTSAHNVDMGATHDVTRGVHARECVEHTIRKLTESSTINVANSTVDVEEGVRVRLAAWMRLSMLP